MSTFKLNCNDSCLSRNTRKKVFRVENNYLKLKFSISDPIFIKLYEKLFYVVFVSPSFCSYCISTCCVWSANVFRHFKANHLMQKLKMKCLHSLLPIFRLYQFCGFAPFPISFDINISVPKKAQYKFYIHSGILTIFFVALFLYNVIFFKEFIGSEDSEMVAFLSIIILTVLRALAVLILIESHFKKNLQIKFLSQLDSVDRIFQTELEISLDYRKMQRNAFIWMGIWQIIIIALLSLILLELIQAYMAIWTKLFWLFCSFPLVISSMRYYQIIHYIRMLGFCFETFNMRLDEIYETTNRLTVNQRQLKEKNLKKKNSKVNKDLVYDNIMSLRRIFHNLWECTGLLNRSFEWSLLFSITASFFVIVVNFYRILFYIFVPKSNDGASAVTFLIWALGHTFYFIKLSSTCHLVSTQVQKIPIQLHNVAYKMQNEDLNNLVREFSLNNHETRF